MGKLSEEIGRIVNLLEDAKEEQDWSNIQNIIADLDDIYDRLDREENGFNYTDE